MKPARFILLTIFLAIPMLYPAAQESDRQKLNEQLWEATRTGDLAAVKSLLDRGADVNAKFRYDQTPLFKAAERGHTEIVKLLLERGAEVNIKDTFYGATPITWAIDKGHTETVGALLEKGAEGADGALLEGARRGNSALVRIVLATKKARPETLTAALAVASASEEKAEIVAALKEAGAAPPLEVDADTLRSYAGRYKNEQGFAVAINFESGKLIAAVTGQPNLTLMAVDRTTFRPAEFDGLTFTFVSEGDRVTGFNLKQGANTTLFKRE